MSVIAVKGIPAEWSLIELVKTITKLVAGPFEPLNFTPGQAHKKTCYLRLSERLDPVRVVKKINSAIITVGPKKFKFNAYVPEHVPDFPLMEKRKKIPMKLRDKLNIPQLELPHEVITNTHHEVFMEIQYKYPGLYNLSRKTEHRLLDEIAQIIGERLTDIMEANSETRDSCFKLSKCYRKMHPHFGDFQLILSTLHQLQDAAGAPRAQLAEAELAATDVQPYVIDNISLNEVKASCAAYCERMAAAAAAHVAALRAARAPGATRAPGAAPGATRAQLARDRVREELEKMLPYIPAVLKQVVSSHFVPEEQPYCTIRIYGEPFLPGRDAMQPLTRRHAAGGARALRSRTMYNLLSLRVPRAHCAALRALDAAVINGAKLTVRSEGPVREASAALRARLAARAPPPRPGPAAAPPRPGPAAAARGPGWSDTPHQ